MVVIILTSFSRKIMPRLKKMEDIGDHQHHEGSDIENHQDSGGIFGNIAPPLDVVASPNWDGVHMELTTVSEAFLNDLGNAAKEKGFQLRVYADLTGVPRTYKMGQLANAIVNAAQDQYGLSGRVEDPNMGVPMYVDQLRSLFIGQPLTQPQPQNG